MWHTSALTVRQKILHEGISAPQMQLQNKRVKNQPYERFKNEKTNIYKLNLKTSFGLARWKLMIRIGL